MVTIKGQQYQVSPISLGDLRALTREGHVAAITKSFNGQMNLEHVEAMIAIISASLVRQNPACTRDWVADNIDVGEAPAALQAVLVASGFVGSPDGPKTASP